MPTPGTIRLVHFTPSFISTFPVQVFAYTCAQNVSNGYASCRPKLIRSLQLFPIYNEIYSNTQKRMNIVIGGSIGAATLTYEVVAVIGYLTFGSKVSDEPSMSFS